MRREFNQHGVAPDRLHVVPLPNTGGLPAAVMPTPKLHPSHVMFIGRLTRLKGAAYAIQAVRLASAALGRALRLTIVGDGPERARLEGLAKRSGVSIEFCGWLGPNEKSQILRQADLLVVPSVWPEPFGLVGIEAGCLGIPAAGFATGGITDWLVPRVSGELASGDPPKVQGLSDAIVRALADSDHYRNLCYGAWRKSMSYSSEAHVSRLELLLASLLPTPECCAALSEPKSIP